MGKYMKKSKAAGDVAVMEVSQSSLGVRTRARTLALQKLQSSSAPSTAPSSLTSYLQLRSRRLAKPSPSPSKPKSLPNPISTNCSKKKPALQSNNSVPVPDPDTVAEPEPEPEPESFIADNLPQTDGSKRNDRETTPCNMISVSERLGSPGSTTRPSRSSATNRRACNPVCQDIPTARVLDEFFARSQEEELKRFKEKYNFDPVNDVPLPGRYEWVKLSP